MGYLFHHVLIHSIDSICDMLIGDDFGILLRAIAVISGWYFLRKRGPEIGDFHHLSTPVFSILNTMKNGIFLNLLLYS